MGKGFPEPRSDTFTPKIRSPPGVEAVIAAITAIEVIEVIQARSPTRSTPTEAPQAQPYAVGDLGEEPGADP